MQRLPPCMPDSCHKITQKHLLKSVNGCTHPENADAQNLKNLAMYSAEQDGSGGVEAPSGRRAPAGLVAFMRSHRSIWSHLLPSTAFLTPSGAQRLA